MVAELRWQSPLPVQLGGSVRGGKEAWRHRQLQQLQHCNTALQWAWLPVDEIAICCKFALSAPVGSGPCSRRHNRRRAQIEQLPNLRLDPPPSSSALPANPPRTASSAPLPPRFLSRDWDGNAFLSTHLTSLILRTALHSGTGNHYLPSQTPPDPSPSRLYE